MCRALPHNVVAIICLLMAALGNNMPALAEDDGQQQLQHFFGDLHSFSADFSQTVRNTTGKILQQSTGTMALQRPLKFRWAYRSPYEQLIITNGNRLWIYDRDLEQLTIKALNNSIGSTPAALLSNDQPLEKTFHIRGDGQRSNLSWVRLTPKKPDTGFELIRLGFVRNTLSVMVLTDSFGQTSTIRFSHLQKNIKLDHKQFIFSPPPGVDVIMDVGKSP